MGRTGALLLLLLATAAAIQQPVAPLRRALPERWERLAGVHRRRELREAFSPSPSPLPSASSGVVSPSDFGADPSGQVDSSPGLQAALDHAFSIPRRTSSLINGIRNLGSVQLDLEGGTYLLTTPLRFPAAGGGNIVLHSGTLRASSSSFPNDGYLVEMRSPSFSSGGLAYEDVTLRDLMLDCGLRGGGIRISSSLRTTLDGLYISHFSDASSGILVEGGHETYIVSCFIGQRVTAGNDPGERSFGGVGIHLDGNDNVVSGCVVFSAAVGIVLRGQANLVHSTHLYNKAAGFGGVGIHVQLPGLSQARILGCYLDFTPIVADAPQQLTISASFFLGDAGVVLRSTSAGQSLRSVSIVGNTFSGSGRASPAVSLDQSVAPFVSWSGVEVHGNTADGMALRSTRASASLRGSNLTTWTLDLSPHLLFPSSSSSSSSLVTFSLHCPNADVFPRSALRSVVNNTVTVETDIAVDGTLSVTVDQASADYWFVS